ncbi:MAG: CDC27 family protein [Sulfurovum sp.]|nr:CDC27 family protein [Sulfurovum sp.]
MYDLKPLEEEWKIYHKKKKYPLYMGIFSGFLLTTAISTLFYFDMFNKNYLNKNILKVETNHSIALNYNDKTKIEIDKNTSNQHANNTELNTTIKDVENHNPVESIVENIPILDEGRENTNNEKSMKYSKKLNINILESSSLEAYKDVEKRFFKSRDIDDSLFLAKNYYRNAKYKKAEFWSLQTNKINSTIDESWIIFAESKVKLGQKNEAINILTDYVKRTGSEKAENTLLKIKSEK